MCEASAKSTRLRARGVMQMRRSRFGGAMVGLAVIAVGALIATCGGAASSGASPPIIVAELFPLTGLHAHVGQWFVHGAQVAVADVNENGGVLGRQLSVISADTGGDPTDAVTAWHRLYLQHPSFEIGPAMPDFDGVAALYDPAKLVEFTEAGSNAFDHMTYKYVYRANPSDSTLSISMAYYAIFKQYKTAALLFESTPNAYGEVPDLVAAYKRHGGKVLDIEKLAPGQSSYRTEIQKAFATPPQVVFIAVSVATANTVFTEIRQLGHLNVPFVTDNSNGPEFAQAMGLDDASKYLVGASGAPPSGPAWQHFTAMYQKVVGKNQPDTLSENMYDAVVIASLAMTDAKSADPAIFNDKILDVANPPGTVCYFYSQCLKLLTAGKKISYQGATGSTGYNKYHNIFGTWSIQGWTSSGERVHLMTVPASAMSTF